MRAEGAPVVDIGVQMSVAGEYRAPVRLLPFQTVITLPAQTAKPPAGGAPSVDIGAHVSFAGLYRPPLLPPQITIKLPVQTAAPAAGAPVVDIGIQLKVARSRRPPDEPFHQMTSRPVQTAWPDKGASKVLQESSVESYSPPDQNSMPIGVPTATSPDGASFVEVRVWIVVAGSYLEPLFTVPPPPFSPPQKMM
jgi:hypothetical protein